MGRNSENKTCLPAFHYQYQLVEDRSHDNRLTTTRYYKNVVPVQFQQGLKIENWPPRPFTTTSWMLRTDSMIIGWQLQILQWWMVHLCTFHSARMWIRSLNVFLLMLLWVLANRKNCGNLFLHWGGGWTFALDDSAWLKLHLFQLTALRHHASMYNAYRCLWLATTQSWWQRTGTFFTLCLCKRRCGSWWSPPFSQWQLTTHKPFMFTKLRVFQANGAAGGVLMTKVKGTNIWSGKMN